MAKILIVDDELDVCNILKDYFVFKGYDVHLAHDGQSAVKLVREVKPHVIMLDILMPGMGGMEALREIRKINTTASVIMVTAITDGEIIRKTQELGADDYIVKPFDLNYVETSVMGKISSALDQAEEKLRESYEKLQKNFDAVIKTLARVVETRDPYTSGHQERVAMLSEAIADEMGLSAERVGIISMAALIHDLGKIYIPAEILTKPSKLSDVEFELIKSHPLVAYEILKDMEFPYPIADYIFQHHERLNGSGYPKGLSDGNILLEAKIIAVADTIEAMASHRPYRPAIGLDKALEEISINRGILYDPDAVDACLRLFREKGFSL
jgi:putative two-component system response regulator